jgi:hypothetical protein
MRPITALVSLFALGAAFTLADQLPFSPSRGSHDQAQDFLDTIGLASGHPHKHGGVPGVTIGGRPGPKFGADDEPARIGVGRASLADRLTVERRGGVWWDYARDVSSVVSDLPCKLGLDEG